MRGAVIISSCLAMLTTFATSAWTETPVDRFAGHPRVAIISDIGNEPDDQMSLVRLLLYSNQLDVEALVASTSVWQRQAVHPETMRSLIQAYAQVRPNLLLHASGWPEADELMNRVYTGQAGYGLGATGPGSLRKAQKRWSAPPITTIRARYGCASGEARTLWRKL